MNRICVQWPRFGPYHMARLQATYRVFTAHQVELVALETAGQDAKYAWRREQATLPFHREQVFPDRVFEEIPPTEMYRGVYAALDRLQPDAVAINSYSFADAQACLAWCRTHRRVAVVMTDSKADDAPRPWWREFLKRQIVQQFDAAFVSGTPQEAYLEALGVPRAFIFQGCNVVDNAYFHEQARQARRAPQAAVAHLPGLDDPAPFFLASNRFIPRKNLAVLLRAYRRYRSLVPAPWRLVLLGDGMERPHLERLVAEHGIDGVIFAGFRQADEIVAYYGRAQAFVHPTLKDQWALVVNEAMAAGLPVLVSNAAGCAWDLVDDGGNGFRFDPTDAHELANRMAQLSDPDTDLEAMGRRSLEIIARYTPERFGETLWDAVQAGKRRQYRPLSPLAAVLLWILRQPRRSDAYHALRADMHVVPEPDAS